MMRIVMCAMLLVLTGCNWTGLKWSPKAKTEQTEQKVKQEKDVVTDVFIDYGPSLTGEPVVMDFFGSKLEVPANTKVTGTAKSNYNSAQTDWSSVISKFDVKTGTGQIVFIGALCLAAAAVLCYLGMWKLGLGVAVAGGVLIACGVLVTQYPWVILLVLGLGTLGVGAFVYYTYRSKSSSNEANDMAKVLKVICDRIDILKKVDPEGVKNYVTDALAKSHDSKLIETITKKLRSL